MKLTVNKITRKEMFHTIISVLLTAITISLFVIGVDTVVFKLGVPRPLDIICVSVGSVLIWFLRGIFDDDFKIIIKAHRDDQNDKAD